MAANKIEFKENELNLSFEVFPPKKDDEFGNVFTLVSALGKLNPHFISVTYGAGGSKSRKTLDIVDYIQNHIGVTALSHLTCVGFAKNDLINYYNELKKVGVDYVLALRGDRPLSMTDEQYNAREFEHATDMISFLNENTDLKICGACYPEKHYEAASLDSDLYYLKEKQDKGCEFFISQLFLDNGAFYRFMDKATSLGITIPICAGIMPVTSAKQLGTTVNLSGSSVPKAMSDLIALYGERPDEMKKAGLDYAVNQINDLSDHGFKNIHIYTMNKASVAEYIVNGIK